ncbi:MAG: MBL fold metallo-hydrolase [Proteobacteria bacterium]|nr:MBL fold metallo-hydrolase [Pseudomonadota bacterium]
MKFSSLTGNSQKLDGGAMFGNAPKVLWEKWIKADDLNRIPLATKSLLVETENHKILFETGIGSFMAPKYRERFGVQENTHILLEGLDDLGLSEKDITEIFLSHLHFDHAGGLLKSWEPEKPPELLFPHARFFVSRNAWERANYPHQRDRASFIPDLNKRLQESGRLHIVEEDLVFHFDDLAIRQFISNGHTPGMICSDLRFNGHRLVVAADLMPGMPWVHLPITMGYDRSPEQLIDEKKALLISVVEDDAWVFFTHDNDVAVSKIIYDNEKKKFKPGKSFDKLVRQPL